MSHKFRKPMPISDARRAAARANGAKSQGPVTPEGKAKSALNAITHGLTASAIVLTTESKDKYAALLASYLEKCDPDGPIEIDLVEEIVAAKWQQRRVAAMIAALLDVEMDCMDKEISEQFERIDNTVRTVLAFKNQVKESATLALLNRYAARHAREYHRALKHLREIQSERLDQNNPPAASPNEKSQNEPKPGLNPDVAPTSEDELATRHSPLATPTGHRPLAPDHREAILQNEPKPGLNPDNAPTSDDELATPTGHRPLATDRCESISQNEPKPGLNPDVAPTSDDELATRHSPLATRHSNWPLATDHCESISQNEPRPGLNPDVAPTSDDELATRHSPLTRPSDHWPLTSEAETGHRPLATDHCSPLATSPTAVR